MREPDNLMGRRFGKLTVVSPAKPYISPSGVRRYVWNCVCDCGNKCIVRGDYLRQGIKLHCAECPPPPMPIHYDKICRDCEHSRYNDDGSFECVKGKDPNKAEKECSGYWCGETDKITGVKHRESKCFICGKPVYSNGNNVTLYCEEHKEFARLDEKILDEAPMELLFMLVAGVFQRARDDYLFDTDGKRNDAEEFLKSEWAKELTLWDFDAEETLKVLDEVIKDGLE